MKTRKILLSIIVLFATSAHLFSQTAEEWKKLGNAESDSANYHKAIEYYQRAIETDSNYFDAYFNLGLAFSTVFEYDKAIEYYQKAITKNNTEAPPFFALGDIYAEKQDFDKAIEMYKKGLELNPDSPEALFYLALLYQENGNLAYATMCAKKAAQMGDTLAQQYFIDNELSWEDDFVKPDYKQIKLNIENNQSDYYYPTLWNRYQQGDSTMTLDEKRHLYYGYVFNEKYSPYVSIPNSEQVNAILNKENPTTAEWEQLVALLNISLAAEPFHCRNLFYQSIAYHQLNKLVEEDKNIKKIQTVVNALNSTGDGLSKETAIHVIAVTNEYDYLFLNNYSIKKQALVNGGYDVLSLRPNDDGLEELWFDVNQSLNFLNRSFGE